MSMGTATKQQNKVPKLRFSGFSDEWSAKTFTDVSEVITGSTPPTVDRENYESGSLPFISPSDLVGNRFVSKTNSTVTQKGFNLGRKITPNSVLFVGIGSTIGKTAQAQGESICNQQIHVLSAKDGYSNDFIYYRLLNDSGRIKLLAGKQAVPLLNKTEFSIWKTNYPAYEEQQKIADFLGSVDAWLNNLRSQNITLETYKRGIMKKLFNGTIRFPEFGTTKLKSRDGYTVSKLGEFPVDWNLKQLKKVLWFQEGPGVRTSQFTRNGVKLLNGTNIQNNELVLGNTDKFISTEEAKSTYKHFLIDEGDMLIACSGISVSKFNEKVTFADKQHLPLSMNTSTMRFKTLDKEVLDIKYFSYYIRTSIFKNQIRRQITGSAQLNFGPSHVETFYILLPSIEEQRKIADFLTTIDQTITAKAAEITQVEQWKKGLMQKMFV